VASAEGSPSTGMNNTTILTGCLCEVQPEAVILAAGTRIALPPALSTVGVSAGSNVLVKVTRCARPQPQEQRTSQRGSQA